MEKKNLLFITSNRLGDAVLSTGLLAEAIRRFKPDSVTIACGPIPAPIFRGVPNLKEIISLEKKEKGMHWVNLWLKTVPQTWDVVIDIRNSLISYLIWAKRAYHFSEGDPAQHKTQQLAHVLGLQDVPAGKIWLDAEANRQADALLPSGVPILALCPTANWEPKQWPAENFMAAARKLMTGKLAGGVIAVFGAANERAGAVELINELSRHYKVVDLIGKTDPLAAAACLARCTLCLANDSGLMHISAAMGTPTLGLFGPSSDVEYAPHGPHAGFVRNGRFMGLGSTPNPKALMEAVSVDMAVDAAQKLL